MIKLILLRHGQSIWNLENKFTGWTDVDLTEKGIEEAREAGRLMEEAGLELDIAYTSYLKRATKTLDLALETFGMPNLEIEKDWRLNERHYGALQGLNKKETAEKEGEELVHQWRRSYDVRPPALSKDDPRWPGHDPMYADIDPEKLPLSECLKDTVERVMPYWNETIAPQIKSGKRVLICAHGNSLRALIKYFDDISEEEISGLNIPTGIPLVYELDFDLNPIRHYYLGDQNAAFQAAENVKNQTKL